MNESDKFILGLARDYVNLIRAENNDLHLRIRENDEAMLKIVADSQERLSGRNEAD